MTGLLKNNFYSAIGSLKVFLGFVFIMAAGLFITGNPILLFGLYVITAPGMAFLSVSGLRKEAASKWARYKLTFPVKRKEIIGSVYVSHAIWTLSGMVLTIMVFAFTILFHGNQYFDLGLRDAAVLVAATGVIALMIGTIFFPLFYILGAEKTEILIIISVIGAVGFFALMCWMINTINGSENISNFQLFINLVIVWITSISLFLLSAVLANAIFRKTEY